MELHVAGVLGLQGGLLGGVAGRAPDVEGPHGELGARLADGLGGDDAHRQPHLHELAGGEVAPVAEGAHPALGLAGEHGADAHPLDARGLGGVGGLLPDLLVGVHQDAALDGVLDLLEADPAHDAVAQGLDDLARLDDGPDLDAVHGAAVVLGDDHVLAHVHQPAGQVAGVRGLERGVGQALARAVGGDEVLQHGQAFAEVRGDGVLDDLAGRTRHEAAHARELADLLLRSARSRVGHDVDRVELRAFLVLHLHLLEHGVRHLLGDGRPDGDDLVVALAVGDRPVLVLLLDVDDLLLGGEHHLLLALGDHEVVDADGDAGVGGVAEAQVLDGVQHLHRLLEAEAELGVLHELLQALLAQEAVDEGRALRQVVVEDDPAHRGVDDLVLDVLDLGVDHVLVVVDGGEVEELTRVHEPHGGEGLDLLVLEGDEHVLAAGEGPALALRALLLLGEVVAAEHDVLRGDGDGLPVRGREDVVRGQHEHAGLDLGLRGEGHVHGHLVPVEVGVEGRADEGMDLDGLALDQDGLEGLDAQAVQGGGAVQEHRVLADHVFQEVPHLGPLLLHHLLGRLDGGDEAFLLELAVDERLEQLEGHLLGQAALVQLQLGADHDDGAARVVDALAQEVLPEAALLALQGVGEGLQGPVVGARAARGRGGRCRRGRPPPPAACASRCAR